MTLLICMLLAVVNAISFDGPGEPSDVDVLTAFDSVSFAMDGTVQTIKHGTVVLRMDCDGDILGHSSIENVYDQFAWYVCSEDVDDTENTGDMLTVFTLRYVDLKTDLYVICSDSQH